MQLLCLKSGRKSEMMLLRRFVLMVLVLLALPTFCLAGWVGPKEVVKGEWGTNPREFGFKPGDPTDSFPGLFTIDENGYVIIADSVNNRIKIYGADGKWQRNFSYKAISPLETWPDNLHVKVGVGILSIYDKLQNYDYNGNLLWSVNVPGTRDCWVTDNGIIIEDIFNKYQLYSSKGEFIKTYTTRPVQLGIVKEDIEHNAYFISVIYPDARYDITSGPYERYERDNKRYIYAISGQSTKKIDACSHIIGELIIPDNRYRTIREAGRGFEEIKQVVSEFGQPIIAPNGDIYTWERTPDSYSILKWTWQDDPNTPSCPDAKIKQAVCDNTGFIKTDMRLTVADLAAKSKEDLRLMRNEIYARHGKTFQSADLQKYFSGKCWYKADPGYSDAMLTPVDREKIRIVQEAEKCK